MYLACFLSTGSLPGAPLGPVESRSPVSSVLSERYDSLRLAPTRLIDSLVGTTVAFLFAPAGPNAGPTSLELFTRSPPGMAMEPRGLPRFWTPQCRSAPLSDSGGVAMVKVVDDYRDAAPEPQTTKASAT